jgi:hypothetical protein
MGPVRSQGAERPIELGKGDMLTDAKRLDKLERLVQCIWLGEDA